MSLTIPPLDDDTPFFTTSDGTPYVRTTGNKGTPYVICGFLISPEVWRDIQIREFEVSKEIHRISVTRSLLQNEVQQIITALCANWGNPYLETFSPDQEYSATRKALRTHQEHIRQLNDQIDELEKYNAFTEILTGNMGYYWSLTRKAYIKTVVTAVDSRYITVQPGIKEIRKILRENVGTPDMSIQLESQVRQQGFPIQPLRIIKPEMTAVKL